METTTDFVSCNELLVCLGTLDTLTVILLVALGQWLQNHCVLGLCRLDQVE